MKGIPADSSAGCDGITFDDLHMADGAKIILVILIILFNNYILSYNATNHIFHIFQEICYLVVMDAPARNYVSQLLISIRITV